MKDQEFIELLNLYLDHEISAADARRLEAEVRSNAERRKVYLEYCRMQKACGVLADQFVSERASEHFVSFARPRRNRAVIIAFGSFAAVAACVALALFLGGRRKAPTATSADLVADTGVAALTVPPRGGVAIASLSSSDLRAPLARETVASAPAADSLEWVRSFQVNASPTLSEPARFEPQPDLFRHELRAVPTSTPQTSASESAAFRFQR